MRAFLIVLARVGLLVITVVTFVTSFDAVAEVAVSLEAVAPELGWTIPLALDGLIVVGSAVLWTESLEDRWHAFPMATVAGASVLSVTANVAHAGSDVLLGQVLAGVPPVALIVAVELAAWQIRRAFRRTRQAAGEVAHDSAAVTAGEPVGQAHPDPAPPADGPAEVRPARSGSRRARPKAGEAAAEVLWPRIAAHTTAELAAGRSRPSQRQLAAALATSRTSVQRALDAHANDWAALAAPAPEPEPAPVGRPQEVAA